VTESIKHALKGIGRTFLISLQLVAVVTVLCVVYGLIADGKFTMSYIFIGNFAAAALVIASALIILVLPANMTARMRKSRLIDHTTYKEAYIEEREKKRGQGYEILFIGIASIILTGVIELLIWVIAH